MRFFWGFIVTVLSLQELCCRSIVSMTTVYGIDQLPLPDSIKSHLKSYALTSLSSLAMTLPSRNGHSKKSRHHLHHHRHGYSIGGSKSLYHHQTASSSSSSSPATAGSGSRSLPYGVNCAGRNSCVIF